MSDRLFRNLLIAIFVFTIYYITVQRMLLVIIQLTSPPVTEFHVPPRFGFDV